MVSAYLRTSEEANVSCFCFVLEIWIKQDKNSSVQISSCIRMVDKKIKDFFNFCISFQVWKRSNFSYASSYFSYATGWKCSLLTADLKENF